MDSLIVLRTPLKKVKQPPSFLIPRQPKRVITFSKILGPIPIEPGLEEPPPEQAGAGVSFVELYQCLCAERAQLRLASPVHFPSPAASLVSRCSPRDSHDSRHTRDSRHSRHTRDARISRHTRDSRRSRCGGDSAVNSQVFPDNPLCSNPKAEIMLELDYGF